MSQAVHNMSVSTQYTVLVRQLMEECQKCTHRKGNVDSYACPSFIDSLNRLLFTTDIPIHSTSSGSRLVRRDPGDAPWNDSVKTLILDIVSFQSFSALDVIVILCGRGYNFSRTSSQILSTYSLGSSKTIVEVVPDADDETLFNISVFMGLTLEYSWAVPGESLPSILSAWSTYENRGLVCHDTALTAYKNAIYMLEGGVWSIVCTSGTFVCGSQTDAIVNYICPVFGCDGSTETRAVGKGSIQFKNNPNSGAYDGALGFYNRSIRGSVHSSGRCYDCEMVCRVLSHALQDDHKDIVVGNVKFVNMELKNSF